MTTELHDSLFYCHSNLIRLRLCKCLWYEELTYSIRKDFSNPHGVQTYRRACCSDYASPSNGVGRLAERRNGAGRPQESSSIDTRCSHRCHGGTKSVATTTQGQQTHKGLILLAHLSPIAVGNKKLISSNHIFSSAANANPLPFHKCCSMVLVNHTVTGMAFRRVPISGGST